jgi:hypothetical protein
MEPRSVSQTFASLPGLKKMPSWNVVKVASERLS